MILPIHLFGDDVLRQPARDVEKITPEVEQLIQDMIDTMHGASGIGLAAPQVGRSEKIFVADLRPMEEVAEEEEIEVPEEPMVFINPRIIEEGDEEVDFEEGCLSIPELREVVSRPDRIRIAYRDRNFEEQEMEAHGILSRVIQHEFDHLEGILFVDRLGPLKKRLLKRRLREISEGHVEADYPVKVAQE
jgi:peptide deformylase